MLSVQGGIGAIAAFIDKAKTDVTYLLGRVVRLEALLAECRDAFSIPAPGTEFEKSWSQAMGNPEHIASYVKLRVGQ